MQKNIFQFMLWANPKSFANSEELSFYEQHSNLFNPKTIELNDGSSLFGLIRSNIILSGALNKKLIDKSISIYPVEMLSNDAVRKVIFKDLPFFTFSDERIYIPTYSQEINRIYLNDPLSLKKENAYLINDSKEEVINPFELYGNRPFSSLFTRLVPLAAKTKDSRAYYHPQFETIFIILDDGTLENEIPLFDEKCKRVSQLKIFEDIEYVADRYYHGTKEEFIHSMYEKNLISKSFHDEIMEVANRNNAK